MAPVKSLTKLKLIVWFLVEIDCLVFGWLNTEIGIHLNANASNIGWSYFFLLPFFNFYEKFIVFLLAQFTISLRTKKCDTTIWRWRNWANFLAVTHCSCNNSPNRSINLHSSLWIANFKAQIFLSFENMLQRKCCQRKIQPKTKHIWIGYFEFAANLQAENRRTVRFCNFTIAYKSIKKFK